MARFGGRAVIPQRYSFSQPAASMVRKNEPTLYMLRTLSSSTLTDSFNNPSYAAEACAAR
jgi:hypothetical protein